MPCDLICALQGCVCRRCEPDRLLLLELLDTPVLHVGESLEERQAQLRRAREALGLLDSDTDQADDSDDQPCQQAADNNGASCSQASARASAKGKASAKASAKAKPTPKTKAKGKTKATAKAKANATAKAKDKAKAKAKAKAVVRLTRSQVRGARWD